MRMIVSRDERELKGDVGVFSESEGYLVESCGLLLVGSVPDARGRNRTGCCGSRLRSGRFKKRGRLRMDVTRDERKFRGDMMVFVESEGRLVGSCGLLLVGSVPDARGRNRTGCCGSRLRSGRFKERGRLRMDVTRDERKFRGDMMVFVESEGRLVGSCGLLLVRAVPDARGRRNRTGYCGSALLRDECFGKRGRLVWLDVTMDERKFRGELKLFSGSGGHLILSSGL